MAAEPDTAEQLTAKLVVLLFADDEIPSILIPSVVLAVCESAPELQTATAEETQFIFQSLCGALAARQVARIAAKSARWVA
jgi:hypothetical protein